MTPCQIKGWQLGSISVGLIKRMVFLLKEQYGYPLLCQWKLNWYKKFGSIPDGSKAFASEDGLYNR